MRNWLLETVLIIVGLLAVYAVIYGATGCRYGGRTLFGGSGWTCAQR